MEKPVISNDFTIEDIHKIREYNAERREKLSAKDKFSDIKKDADKCEKEINKLKKSKVAI